MGKGPVRSLCERAAEDQALPSQHAVFFLTLAGHPLPIDHPGTLFVVLS